MRLLHYSREPLRLDLQYNYDKPRFLYKPAGLWVSVEGERDWPEWCEAEEFRVDELKFVSEVILKPKANVLTIKTVEELDHFHKLYCLEEEDWVLWPKVMARYQGIIIAPYQWKRRLKYHWYYGWDCASGCIWDLSCIAEVKEGRANEEIQQLSNT